MSLFESSNLIIINVYYKFKKVANGKKLVIIDDKKAEELLKKEGSGIEKLETKWSSLTWEDQNKVMDVSFLDPNPKTGDRLFSMSKYRDAVVKRCLKEWDMVENGEKIPITAEIINKLPAPIILNLFRKFEEVTEYSEEDWGN